MNARYRPQCAADLGPSWQAEYWPGADGAELCLWRHPRQQAGRPTLHFAHATGLTGLSYRRLLEPLAERLNLCAWDMRFHGLSQPESDSATVNWSIYYRDMQSLLVHFDEPVILAGHSVGGMCSAAAASACPDKVQALLLFDPVILAGVPAWALRLNKALGRSHPLAAQAHRRRELFAGPQAIVESYRGRGIFQSWTDEMLADYAESGFEAVEGGRRLRCRPAMEAASFEATELWPFPQLEHLPMPGGVWVADRLSTMPAAARRAWRRRFPHLPIQRLPDSTHMLPFEQPDLFRKAFEGLLDQLGGMA